MSSPFVWSAFASISAVSMALGALLILGGSLTFNRPQTSKSWGIVVLVASVVGLVVMSGFFIDPILGIIAGILALAKK